MKFMRKKYGHKGLSLIEIVTVVAIIAILVTITIGISGRVETAAKEKRTQAAINLLVSAIEKYYQFHSEFPLMEKDNATDQIDVDDYYDYSETDFKADIADGLTVNIAPTNSDEYLVNEALYFSLNRTPPCREILDKIEKTLVTSKDDSNTDMTLTVDGRDYPLYRVTDSWKTPLRYTYDKEYDSFPLIESAGPDKIFGDGSGVGDSNDVSYAEDNITSR